MDLLTRIGNILYIDICLLGVPNTLQKYDGNSHDISQNLSYLKESWLFCHDLVAILLKLCITVTVTAAYIGETTVLFVGTFCIWLCSSTLMLNVVMSWPLSWLGRDSDNLRRKYSEAATLSNAAIFTRPSVLAAIPSVFTLYSAVSTVVLFSIAVVQLPVPSCPVEATADQPSASSSSPIPICRPRYTLLDIVVNLPMPFRIAAVVMMVVSLSYTAFNWYYFQKLVPFSAPSDIEANVQSFTGAQGPASDSEHACPTNADTPPVGDSQAPPSTT